MLTITADRVRLFHASRFSLTEEEGEDLPRGLGEELGEPDYENPVQASPVARPHTGSVDISYAQVYGDSPAEWRKGRLVEYTRRVAAAVDQRMVSRPVPLVLAADTEIAGHFRKSSRLGPLLAGVIKANPESMDDTQLHDAAYTVVRPRLDADRQDALDRFEALHASGDVRAATGVTEVVRAAHQGRVDTLLLTETGPIWGRYDRTADQVVTYESYGASGQDLLDVAAIQTLHNGGLVHLMTPDTMPGAAAAAILRY